MHRAIIVSLSLLAVLWLSGCRTFVELSSDRYVPRLPPTIYGYEGTQLLMQGFENRANDTSIFYYYSPTSRASYGGPVLASYLWYSFQKALLRLGIHVYNQPPAAPVPEMRLGFLSWNDQHFQCEVQLLFPGQVPFVKQYGITSPAPVEDPAYMEQQAYRQVDQIVSRIFDDPEFAAAFLRSQSRGAVQLPASPLPPPPAPSRSRAAPSAASPVQTQPGARAPAAE